MYEGKSWLCAFAAAAALALASCGEISNGRATDAGGLAGAGGEAVQPKEPQPSPVFVNEIASPCLPRRLSAEADGAIVCSVVEAMSGSCAGACAELPGRSEVVAELEPILRAHLLEDGYCGTAMLPNCDSFCFCQIAQLAEAELEACRTTEALPAELSGFCYVDPGQGFGSTELTEACPPQMQFMLRFVGTEVPRAGAVSYLACLGN